MNGIISYNTPSEEQGFTFENIVFDIKDGRIVKATANDDARINGLLDTDEGARFFGEFALGVNPYILHPMKDTLFDEKIAGSFHLTPGASYEDAPNGKQVCRPLGSRDDTETGVRRRRNLLRRKAHKKGRSVHAARAAVPQSGKSEVITVFTSGHGFPAHITHHTYAHVHGKSMLCGYTSQKTLPHHVNLRAAAGSLIYPSDTVIL